VVKFKIKKGDTVEVISGREKGVRGEVLRVVPKDERLVVQGVNVRKKHQRKMQKAGRTMSPGVISFEAPVHLSNVMLVCPKCSEPVRVGLERTAGKSRRVCKNCETVIDA
jgi:large subunit ribosomal protein L24